MKIVVLGAGKSSNEINESLLNLTNKHLQALSKNNKYEVYFVGGNDFYNYVSSYPDFNFYFNKEWESTGVLASLFMARELFNGEEDILVTYSDILFSQATFDYIVNARKPIVIATKELTFGKGRQWHKAEKVDIDDGIVKSIGKHVTASNQFLGIMKVQASEQQKFKLFLETLSKKQNSKIHEADNFSKAYLTDFLHEYAQRHNIYVQPIDTAWAEIDYPKDVERFIFGTKAETLRKLKEKITTSVILDQVCIEVGAWLKNERECVDLIQSTFSESTLVIRSSTFAEDSKENSFAGAFESVLNVKKDSIEEIQNAITQVIKSYKQYGVDELHKNQILIQPQLQGVLISGVVMTRDIVTGAPYYTVNYDDISSLTDTITSGTENLKSLICLREHINKVKHPQLYKLLVAVQEVETIIDSSTLDIEFAITTDNIYLFQARPITTLYGKELNKIDELYQFIEKELLGYKQLVGRKSQNLLGRRSLYANMPDWNPAEIIGIRPKPLASSLYKYLIMDEIWLQSRKEIGYHVPTSEVLMQMYCGQPYIDTRVSFNTLVPNNLPLEIKEKLVNYYIEKLERNPQLHDKVEFDILYTCYDFTSPIRLQELEDADFTIEEIGIILNSLLALTNQIITGKVASIEEQHKRLEELEKKREVLTSNDNKSIYFIRTLLNDCRKYGTLPFSNFARYAFISVSLLKSLVSIKVITESQYNEYLASIETVATYTMRDLELLAGGDVTKEQFLAKYGHLRPGTYDITSPRYDEAFDNYFTLSKDNLIYAEKNREVVDNIFSEEDYKKIDYILEEHGFELNASQLFKFIKESIEGREYAKFEFTKNLSLALKMIEKIAVDEGLRAEDIQFLTIEDILRNNQIDLNLVKDIISRNKQLYEKTELVKLPSLIKSDDDFYAFTYFESQPNYITRNSITAELLVLNDSINSLEIDIYKGKIIVIESADPGYDWIFSYKIAGLITKFGGANSHMAIRCAEFKLPAAIGCGEVLYNRVKESNKVLLNCGAEKIEII